MAGSRVIRMVRDAWSWNQRRCYSSSSLSLTNKDVRKKRNEMFEQEKARQMTLIPKIEKIQVEYKGQPEDCSLLMNKGLSTPFNCAMHIQELLMERSVVAQVNGQPWDMHRPLVEDCELRFLHFKEEDPSVPNEVFWRSCSFILGHILETAFKDCYYVELCSFPKPNVRSGSFIYDADLKLTDWSPSTAEMNCLSRIGTQLSQGDYRFERLDVDASLAQTMFEDNRFKSQQIPSIAAHSSTGSTVPVYRFKDHVDISQGPLMSSPNLLNRYQITAVHEIESPDYGPLHRVQGMSLPKQLPMHFWTYDLLCERAATLNSAPVPSLQSTKQVECVTDTNSG